MLDFFIDALARRPAILNFLRSLLENGHQGEHAVIQRELPDRLSQRVLDLGCGTGTFAPWFGPDYVGVDISSAYTSYARRKYNKNFLVMDAQHLNLPEHSFDAIWVNGVFHHLNDQTVSAVLREMKRVLKTAGRAVVMEDIPSSLFISKLLGSLDVGDNIRLPAGYRQLLQEYFTVIKEYPVRTGVCDFQVFVLT